MKSRAPFTINALIFAALALAAGARAQEHDAPKVELGVQYSSLSVNLPVFGGTENVAGFGGRATYNLNDYFAVEAEGNVHPSRAGTNYVTGGASQQMQFGVKAGKRWNTFGVFAKARPGFVSFSKTLTPTVTQSSPFNIFNFTRERKTHFSMDVGGVLEFYPSRRVLVRFDAGDTIIRYGEHREFVPFPISAGDPGPQPVPTETTHNFQFTAGVGFRFGGGAEPGGGGGGPQSGGGGERVRRFEVGAQFSSLMLRPPSDGFFPFASSFDEGSEAEAGGGARLGFNATDDLAFEVEGNFYPRRRFSFDTAIGGYPSQLQAGVKYGRRFDRFGVFAKARPGFVNFSSVNEVSGYEAFHFDGQTFFSPTFRETSKTYFSMDVGGVFEFYPSSRVLTRFDVGDTMIRYPPRNNPNGALGAPPPRLPAELRHNLQVTAGIGFRF